MSDSQAASISLIENLQREELTAIEEAMAYQKLIEIHQLTQESLAQRLGKGTIDDRKQVAFIAVAQEVKEALLRRSITERHARALLSLSSEEQQLHVLQGILERNLNVKQTEDWIRRIKEQKQRKGNRSENRFLVIFASR